MTRSSVDGEVLGIVGGMGPSAGVHFAQRLIHLNSAACRDADHPRMILHSDPTIPDRVQAFRGRGATPVPAIVAALTALGQSGATFATLVCNSAHIWLDEIRAGSGIEVLDMPGLTAEFVGLSMGGSAPGRVGILGTSATAETGLYSERLSAVGVEAVLPDPDLQFLVDETIFNPKFGLKASGLTPNSTVHDLLASVVGELVERSQVEAVILGCTELSVAVPENELAGVPAVDPVDVTATVCLERLIGTESVVAQRSCQP